jgi:streptogramin lyase
MDTHKETRPVKRYVSALILLATIAVVASGPLRAQTVTAVRFVQWPLFYAVGAGIRIDTIGDPGTQSPAGTIWATTRQENPKLIRLFPGTPLETAPASWTAWSLASGVENSEGIAITADDQIFVRSTIGLQRIDPSTNVRTLWADGFSKSDLALGSGTSVWTALFLGPVQRLVPDGPSSPGATVTRWIVGGSGELSLAGIAVTADSSRVYVSYNADDAIVELDPSTNQVRHWSTGALGVTRPRNLAIDPSGDVWVVSRSNHIVRLRPSTNELTVFAIPSAGGDPYGIFADGVIGFTELTLGKIGLLIPTGSPTVITPSVTTVVPTTFRLTGEMNTETPVVGTSSPIVTDVPATASGSDTSGFFIEATLPGATYSPMGIDRKRDDPPGTFYYAATGERVIGRASLPTPEEALVTGGGWIDVPGGRASFSFTAFRKEMGGAVKGNFRYKNHVTGETIQSVELDDLLVYGTDAIFSGTMMVGNVPAVFTVKVSDQGEPGTNDTFRVTVAGTTTSNTLAGGNIQIHRKD